MKKWGYIISFLIIVIIAVIIGIYFLNYANKNEVKNDNEVYNTTIIEEIPSSIKNEITIQTTIEQEKVSPNATLILKKHYQECGHTIKEYVEIPKEFVNLNKEDLQKEYAEWEIEKFSALEIVFIRDEEGVCKEHYLLKETNGIIGVYKIENDKDEILIEETGISTEYLTENDKMKIEEGIKVYGKEELNSVLEDYE